MKLAPSILSADFSRLGEHVDEVRRGGADLIHVDVMDGQFVPNLTMGPLVVRALRKVTDLPLDVHLMVVDPERLLDEFIDAGASYISAHVEATPHMHRLLEHIRSRGVKAGAAINPGTSISVLEPLAEFLDFVLVMSVNPGFPAQKFITTTPERLRKVRAMFDDRGLDAEIEVDGGIGETTGPLVVAAGASMLVAGSAVFDTPSPEETARSLKKRFMEALP